MSSWQLPAALDPSKWQHIPNGNLTRPNLNFGYRQGTGIEDEQEITKEGHTEHTGGMRITQQGLSQCNTLAEIILMCVRQSDFCLASGSCQKQHGLTKPSAGSQSRIQSPTRKTAETSAEGVT